MTARPNGGEPQRAATLPDAAGRLRRGNSSRQYRTKALEQLSAGFGAALDPVNMLFMAVAVARGIVSILVSSPIALIFMLLTVYSLWRFANRGAR